MEESEETQTGMPPFLKVLCILTFIGSGLGLLGAISGFFMEEFTRKSLEVATSIDQSTLDLMGTINLDEMIKWQRYINIANLIGSALCLMGAVLMWRLKKTGYFMYIPGVIIPVIVSAIGMKFMMSGIMASFGAFGIVINGVIATAFIIMYGLNYKHMK